LNVSNGIKKQNAKHIPYFLPLDINKFGGILFEKTTAFVEFLVTNQFVQL